MTRFTRFGTLVVATAAAGVVVGLPAATVAAQGESATFSSAIENVTFLSTSDYPGPCANPSHSPVPTC